MKRLRTSIGASGERLVMVGVLTVGSYYFVRRGLSAADRTFHQSVEFGAGFGSGPMHPVVRSVEARAECRPVAGAEQCRVTAFAVGLVQPVGDVEAQWLVEEREQSA